MPTIDQRVTLEIENCCACYVVFAMPAEMQKQRLIDGECFYCPNGHSQHYSKAEIAKVREQLEEVQRKLSAAKCNEASERSAREQAEKALRRHKTRTTNGVCPCCNRSFTNLRRHMATKHPNEVAKP